MKNFCEHCFELKRNCICRYETCIVCKQSFSNWDDENPMYEYRGVMACEKCIDEAREKRDFERQEIIAEEKRKTDVFRGLDMSDSIVGKANRKILKSQIEIASRDIKNSRINIYEGK